jgi:hypothetical protein
MKIKNARHTLDGIRSQRGANAKKKVVMSNLVANALLSVDKTKSGNPNKDNVFVWKDQSNTTVYALSVHPIRIPMEIHAHVIKASFGTIKPSNAQSKSVLSTL